MKSKIILSLCLLFSIEAFSKALIAPDTNGLRSDTVDILNYTINLNVTDFVTDTLRGNTVIRFTPKMNGINTLSLDLQHMTVDSIEISNAKMGYAFNDTLITIALPSAKNIGDTTDVTVYYHGKPLTDPSGVGGFSFQSPYAYYIGEANTYIPQSFGRCFYPCFDNFRERATYTFNITCDTSNRAICNGFLAHDTIIGANRTRTWIMKQTIPSYLVSVDIGPYVQVNDTFKGTDTIPILIATIKSDSSKVRGAFSHLKSCTSIYENCFGRYAWNKIGFTEINASGVSIEDASNIAYPNYAFSPSFEYLMAHEFGHHWFGDKVTCWAASDMWLNEGFATYCQYIYAEYLYGNASYRTFVRNNHEQVLQFTYIYDKGYRALSGMNAQYTFGNTTYNKGADVIATLRGYLGDSNFFHGLQYYLSSHKYQPVTPDTLEKSLERYSGTNLTDFFKDWVYAPGFAQFSIDSMQTVPSGPNYNVTIYVRQKLCHAPAFYNNVPLQVTFKSGITTGTTKQIIASGQYSSFSFTLPFKPVFTALNLNEAIQADAIAPDTMVIPKIGTYNFTNAQLSRLTVTSMSDTAFVYVEHNFVAPDPVKDTSLHYRISPNHYWKVSGIYPATFKATALFYFDGNKNTGGNGYMDTALTVYTRDSIILLYRKSAAYDWKEFPGYIKKNIGPSTSMYGSITPDSLPQGEYAFANGVSHVLGVTETIREEAGMNIYPNPTANSFTIQLLSNIAGEHVTVHDMQGNLLEEIQVKPGQNNYIIRTDAWKNGTYLVTLRNSSKEVITRPIVVAH